MCVRSSVCTQAGRSDEAHAVSFVSCAEKRSYRFATPATVGWAVPTKPRRRARNGGHGPPYKTMPAKWQFPYRHEARRSWRTVAALAVALWLGLCAPGGAESTPAWLNMVDRDLFARTVAIFAHVRSGGRVIARIGDRDAASLVRRVELAHDGTRAALMEIRFVDAGGTQFMVEVMGAASEPKRSLGPYNGEDVRSTFSAVEATAKCVEPLVKARSGALEKSIVDGTERLSLTCNPAAQIRAIDLCASQVRTHPMEASLWLALGRSYALLAGEYWGHLPCDAARELWRRGAAAALVAHLLRPGSAETTHLLHLPAWCFGSYTAAASYCKDALLLAPAHFGARRDLAAVQESCDVLEGLLKERPQDMYLRFRLARVEARHGDDERTLALFKEVLDAQSGQGCTVKEGMAAHAYARNLTLTGARHYVHAVVDALSWSLAEVITRLPSVGPPHDAVDAAIEKLGQLANSSEVPKRLSELATDGDPDELYLATDRALRDAVSDVDFPDVRWLMPDNKLFRALAIYDSLLRSADEVLGKGNTTRHAADLGLDYGLLRVLSQTAVARPLTDYARDRLLRWHGALDSCENLLAACRPILGDHPCFILTEAAVERCSGRPERYREVLQSGLERGGDHHQVMLALARSYLLTAEIDNARQAYTRGLERFPMRATVLHQVANPDHSYIEIPGQRAAIARYSALHRPLACPAVWHCRQLLREGQVQEVARVLGEVRLPPPKHAIWAMEQMADLYLKIDDRQKAAELLQKRVQSPKASTWCYIELAKALAATGRAGDGLAVLDSYAAETPPLPDRDRVLSTKAHILIDQDGLDGAEAALAAVPARRQHSFAVTDARVRLFRARGQDGRILDALQAQRERYPCESHPYLRLAERHIDNDDLGAAEEALREGIKRSGDLRRDELRALLMAILVKRGRDQEARSMFTELKDVRMTSASLILLSKSLMDFGCSALLDEALARLYHDYPRDTEYPVLMARREAIQGEDPGKWVEGALRMDRSPQRVERIEELAGTMVE